MLDRVRKHIGGYAHHIIDRSTCLNLFDPIRKAATYRWSVRSAVSWAGAGICLIIAIAAIVAAAETEPATILSIPTGQFLAVLATPAALAGIVLASGAVRERLARGRGLRGRL